MGATVAKRKGLSKKTRFEVFKRDSFTCQYCGAKAPEVILHVDHIRPVDDGGENDILNLITSCQGCNSGKGARVLGDSSVVQKQHSQLADLEERRQQIEMMLRWRDDLSNLDAETVEAICARMVERSGIEPNENGKADIRRWLKNYSVTEILEAASEAFDIYLQYEGDEPTSSSWNKAFNKIPGVAGIRRQKETKPYLQKLFYIQGILRKRTSNKWMRCIDAMESFVLDGLSVEQMEIIAKRSDSWDDFCERCESELAGGDA